LAIAADKVRLEALNAFVEVWPRQPVTLLMQITNEHDRSLELTPSVRIPEGWRQIVPASSLILGAGESQTTFVTLLPEANLGAGEYDVRVEYSSEDGAIKAATLFKILVMSDSTIDISVLEVPEYASEGLYTAEFLVRNAGNVHQCLQLSAKENLGFKISVEPAYLDLAAGDSAIVTLRVEVDDKLTTSRRHRVQVVVDDAVSKKTLALASAWVTIIPAGPSKFAIYNLFPVNVTLKAEVDKDGVLSSWYLYGRGTLPGVKSSRLGVRATEDRQLLSLSTPEVAFSIGDQGFYLSPLTDAGTWGKGFLIRSSKEAWSSQFQWYTTESQGDVAGVRLAYRAARQATVAFNYLHLADDFSGIQSVESVWTPSERLTTRAEFGTQIGNHYGPTAMALSGSYRGSLGDTIVDWQRTDARYRQKPEALNRLSVQHRTDVGEHSWLSLRWQQRGQLSEGEPSSSEQVTTTIGGTLGGQVEDGSWWIRASYRTVEQDGEINHSRQSLWFSLLQRASEFSSVSVSLGYEHRTNGDTVKSFIPGRVHYRAPLLGGTLSAFVRAQYKLSENANNALGYSVSWTADTGIQRTRLLYSSGGMNHRNPSMLGSVEYRLDNGHRYYGKVAYSWAGADKGWNITVGYTLPLTFDIPLGMRADVGRVQGRILDEHGQGIEGLIVRLGGQVTKTQPDGSYCFSIVPVGEILLSIAPEDIGPDRVASPSLPCRVRVTAGETIEQDFRLIPVAQLHGSVRLLSAPSDDAPNGALERAGRSQPDPSVLKGMVIELRNDSQTYRRLIQNSDINGSQNDMDINDVYAQFRFSDLLPGTWQIAVHRNGLPGYL